ncbi:MAG: CRISPR system precrRNA processing endoribonuclease RAMP protein Cas6 [bacterium]
MLYSRFTFTAELIDEAFLPSFKGSTFRGAFGRALRKVTCALRRKECRDCLLCSRCVYALFFEDKKGIDLGAERKSSSPHPFVIEPPLMAKNHFAPGENFEFNLILFGHAAEYLPYCIFAFEQMGRRGIGQHVQGKRAGFFLKTVSCTLSSGSAHNQMTVYSCDDQKIKRDDYSQKLSLQEPPVAMSNITVYFKTPLRVKHSNHLKDNLPFHILIRAALRRISSLFNCYGEGEPSLDYAGLVTRAHTIKTKEVNLRWRDWERYSNRQETRMLMGGIVGYVVYQGNLNEFYPLLRICEIIHLGKQTTFGLGKIALEIT